MKRLLAPILLAAVLLTLSGCAAPVPEVQASEEAPPVPETTLPPSIPATPTTQPTVPPTEPTETEVTEPPAPPQPEPEDGALVRIADYIPNIHQALAYATEENFTGRKIYDFTDAYLRYGTVKKLAAVSAELEDMGLSLVIWDGFRPISAQFKLWEICPDDTYVANPNTGCSAHNRGNAVDLTLMDAEGNLLEMPTGFDDFSLRADRDYTDCSPAAAENARLLERVMETYGFKGYWGEWWHFADTETYPVPEDFTPISVARYYAQCQEFITLRARPDTAADAITRIGVGEEFDVLAIQGDFFLVHYQGLQGYVLRSYTMPVNTISS